MKPLFPLLACALVLALPPAHAQSPAQKAQQEKMAQCNKDAGDKKGDERKAFMKDCLAAKPAPAKNAQQEKMKSCNAQAAGKTGEERKAFMKDCLKGS